jgi:hypothetical protein
MKKIEPIETFAGPIKGWEDFKVGSQWRHRILGVVTVTRHMWCQPPEDCYYPHRHLSGVEVKDGDGKNWSCRSPTDLSPVDAAN